MGCSSSVAEDTASSRTPPRRPNQPLTLTRHFPAGGTIHIHHTPQQQQQQQQNHIDDGSTNKKASGLSPAGNPVCSQALVEALPRYRYSVRTPPPANLVVPSSASASKRIRATTTGGGGGTPRTGSGNQLLMSRHPSSSPLQPNAPQRLLLETTPIAGNHSSNDDTAAVPSPPHLLSTQPLALDGTAALEVPSVLHRQLSANSQSSGRGTATTTITAANGVAVRPQRSVQGRLHLNSDSDDENDNLVTAAAAGAVDSSVAGAQGTPIRRQSSATAMTTAAVGVATNQPRPIPTPPSTTVVAASVFQPCVLPAETNNKACNRPEDAECSICLGGLVDTIVVVLPCLHQFHDTCATRWLLHHDGSCPDCRLPVVIEHFDVDSE